MKKPLIVGSLILGIDFLTKLLTSYFIPKVYMNTMWYPYGGIPVMKDFLGINFSLTHITNKGAAWGALADFQQYLLAARIVLIIAMIGYLWLVNKNKSVLLPFTLVIAGAIGNVIDFYLYGHVIDMFHFVLWGYDFAVFNFADASISIGIVWLCLLHFCGKPSTKHVQAR